MESGPYGRSKPTAVTRGDALLPHLVRAADPDELALDHAAHAARIPRLLDRHARQERARRLPACVGTRLSRSRRSASDSPASQPPAGVGDRDRADRAVVDVAQRARARGIRRSDFNLVAFGTRCEPHRMSDELKSEFKTALDTRWNALKPDRSPNDIARHGTKDAKAAIVAYGLLRLAGAMRGRAGREEDADADRILDGAHTRSPSAKVHIAKAWSKRRPVRLRRSWVRWWWAADARTRDTGGARRTARSRTARRRQLLGLVLATPFALGGVMLSSTRYGRRRMSRSRSCARSMRRPATRCA